MKHNNKGYSFVEMIIVLAIIVILSGISLLSITIINTARAKQASTVFGDEVSSIKQKNMSMSPVLTEAAYADKKASYGLVLHSEDGKFKVTQVELYEYTGTSTFYKYVYVPGDTSKVKRVDTSEMSSSVDVKFNGYFKSFQNGDDNSGNSRTDYVPAGLDNSSTGSVCILFDKRGNCVSGYGTYSFCKKNGNEVATVIVRKNGSIEIR